MMNLGLKYHSHTETHYSADTKHSVAKEIVKTGRCLKHPDIQIHMFGGLITKECKRCAKEYKINIEIEQITKKIINSELTSTEIEDKLETTFVNADIRTEKNLKVDVSCQTDRILKVDVSTQINKNVSSFECQTEFIVDELSCKSKETINEIIHQNFDILNTGKIISTCKCYNPPKWLVLYDNDQNLYISNDYGKTWKTEEDAVRSYKPFQVECSLQKLNRLNVVSECDRQGHCQLARFNEGHGFPKNSIGISCDYGNSFKHINNLL